MICGSYLVHIMRKSQPKIVYNHEKNLISKCKGGTSTIWMKEGEVIELKKNLIELKL